MSELWYDPDVQDIIDIVDGQPFPKFSDLYDFDNKLMAQFVELDKQVGGPVPAEVVVNACIAGVRATELITPDLLETNTVGWKKFVIYMTGHNALILHSQYDLVIAAVFAAWAMEALKRVGVAPDGFATSLGTLYSNLMAIPEAAVVPDPVNPGQVKVRGGDEARQLAGIV